MTMKLTRCVVTTSSFNYIEMLAPEMVTEFNQQDLKKDANNDNFKEDCKCKHITVYTEHFSKVLR
jgi:hypothetical protein